MIVEKNVGEFYPADRSFDRDTHTVLVMGVPRTDYQVSRRSNGELVIVFDSLTYDELHNIEVYRNGALTPMSVHTPMIRPDGQAPRKYRRRWR